LLDELDEEQTLALNGAIEKLARLGERGGVVPEQIVALLDSGMNVDELIHYLVLQVSREVALHATVTSGCERAP